MRSAHHLLAGALLLGLAACSSSAGDSPAADAPAPTTSSTTPEPSSALIALGDSFTAGPGLGESQDKAGFCQRSTRNWPSLAAAKTGLDLHDVSCVGATTADLASTVATGILEGGARVVTVGTGGNDSGLFSSLISSCASGGDACRAFVEGDLPDILDTTTRDITALLTTVRKAVPDAEVLLVGYPRIVPTAQTCSALGVPATDLELLDSAEEALDRALAQAAEEAGETYVSVRDASRGHDACAGADAWTNGRSAASDNGISFHPTARGMEAVADLVAATIPDLRSPAPS